EDLALLGIGCHGSLLFVLAPAARSPAARVRSLTRKASRFDRPVRVTNVSGFLSDRPTAHDRYAPSRAPDAAQRFFSGALLIRGPGLRVRQWVPVLRNSATALHRARDTGSGLRDRTRLPPLPRPGCSAARLRGALLMRGRGVLVRAVWVPV